MPGASAGLSRAVGIRSDLAYNVVENPANAQDTKGGKLPISAPGIAAIFPIAQSATKVTTRTSRSIDSPPLAWLFDHWLRTLTNEAGTSQELMADYFFGGIADKRKLPKDGADDPLSEILEPKA